MGRQTKITLRAVRSSEPTAWTDQRVGPIFFVLCSQQNFSLLHETQLIAGGGDPGHLSTTADLTEAGYNKSQKAPDS